MDKKIPALFGRSMREIFHELTIQASAEQIYQTLTNESLISQWWLPGSKLDAREGALGTFPLSDGKSKIVMQVLKLLPNKRVVWKCLEHKFSERSGTTVSFEILAGPGVLLTTHGAVQLVQAINPCTNSFQCHFIF